MQVGLREGKQEAEFRVAAGNLAESRYQAPALVRFLIAAEFHTFLLAAVSLLFLFPCNQPTWLILYLALLIFSSPVRDWYLS